MTETANSRQLARVLIFGGAIVTLSMGIRHSFGLYLQPMSADLGWGRETFAFAIAVQNLLWGLAQPFVGMVADLYGGRRVLMVGAACYIAGLYLMSSAATSLGLNLSAGLLIGLALAGTTYSVIYGIVGRSVSAEGRSRAMGIVGAAGSLGQFLMLPFAQSMIDHLGWHLALMVCAGLVALIIPSAAPLKTPPLPTGVHQQSVREALQEALKHRGFILLCFSYFVCGFQVVFVGIHLPAYLTDQGLSPSVGTTCLALIGLLNIFGTYLFGQWGGRHSQKNLLAVIYFGRAVAITLFIVLPLSPISAMIFAMVMGFLWLATVPLTNGLIARVFGVQYLAMLGGFSFFSHQIGAFFGVWLGGKVFDVTGSYSSVWIGCLALGVVAGCLCLPIQERPVARLQAA